MLSKLITKKEWSKIRDSELYSRGDSAKHGNPNIRVLSTPEGYKLRVGLPGARQFFYFTLYIPEKFQEQFKLYSDCYAVRIKNKDGKYFVYIGLNIPDVTPIYGFKDGCIGIDTNPDGLAVVDIDKSGNLLEHIYLSNSRIQLARHEKRKNDIETLALKVINCALLKGKGIVLEDLKFSEGRKGHKKFNRMKHNFIYSQLLRAIERRALKDGVEVRKVNPAFTSITGILKYQDLYSLNRHTAAALVIARRGYGIMERVRVRLESLEKDRLNLAGRDRSIALTRKAYSYFKHLYRVFEVETPGLTAPCLSPRIGNYGTG